MATAFAELAGSPEELYDPNGFTATRQILVAWEDRDAMVRALLGDALIFGGSDLATYPNRSDVVVKNIRSVPWKTKIPDDAVFTDIEDDLNDYTGQFAHMTIAYEWLPPFNAPFEFDTSIEKGTLVAYSSKLAGEYRSLPGINIVWAANDELPVPKDAAQTIRVPIIEHHFKWSRVTRPPEAAMRAKIGKVNDALWNGFKKETLLYEGAAKSQEFVGFAPTDPLADLQGSWGPWKVSHVFRELVIDNVSVDDGTADPGEHAGWNHTWRTVPADEDPKFDRLIAAFDADKPNPTGQYEVTNFDALFQNG
jgi:hypothetical protein